MVWYHQNKTTRFEPVRSGMIFGLFAANMVFPKRWFESFSETVFAAFISRNVLFGFASLWIAFISVNFLVLCSRLTCDKSTFSRG